MKAGALVAIVLALAPAACAGDPTGCDAAVNQDPTVRDLRAKAAGSETFRNAHGDEVADAVANARTACLRARGRLPPGGVERPVRERNLFNGLF